MNDTIIYTGGTVRTMDPARPLVEAFAVVGDRFGAVGTATDVRNRGGSRARIVDLGGRTVCPGFIETHNHLSDQAMNLLEVDCTPESNANIDAILARLKETAARTPPGRWIVGHGYNDDRIAGRRHIKRQDLDAAVPDHPVCIHHVTGHMAYVNSRALAASGLADGNVPAVEGGAFGRNTDGSLNGLLYEPGAMDLVAGHIPPPTAGQLVGPLERAIAEFNRQGVTSIHDAGLGWSGRPDFILKAYQDLHEEGNLHVRVYLSIMHPYYRPLKELGLRSRFGSPWLKLGSVKLFQDGSIQIHTAALRRPYHDRPDLRGEPIHAQEQLDRLVEEFHAAGCQVAVHCNGDAAISSVLESLEKAQRKHPRPDPRHLLIHCQMADEEHIARMKAAGAMPSYFIKHVYYWGDSHHDRFLGPERATRISPLAATVKQDLPFTLHADTPVTPVSPLFAVHCAVNRTTRSGRALGADLCIDAATALKAYTTWGAMASFEEDLKGSIEPGKLADFVVLSADPVTVPPQALKDIEVLTTVVGGRRVHGRW